MLSAISTSGIFAVIFIDKTALKIVTAVFSAISLFINSYFKTYDFKTLAKQHKKSALDLLELREELISILCDIKLNKYEEENLRVKRDEILTKQINIYKKCLDTSDKAVNMASGNLKDRKDNTHSDEEIDSFLPVLARKCDKTIRR